MQMTYTTHTVKKGEHLTRIARDHGWKKKTDWKELYGLAVNAPLRKKRPDPDHIEPGDTVLIPIVSREELKKALAVLMEADLTGEIAHSIKNLPNVIGFLGAEKGGDPVPLRQSEVNRILGTVDELAENVETNFNPYHVGEGVKVIDGPFNGFNGVIEEINEEKKKLKVMVKIFGRKTPLELSFMQVEKEV